MESYLQVWHVRSVATGFGYSFKKTRGMFITAGLTIPFTGRAPEGAVATFTNEQTVTYSAIDGHGVHVDTDDEDSGSVVVNFQGTSPSCHALAQLAAMQNTLGAKLKGILTLTDMGGTSTLVLLTNAMLSSNPGITYASGQPMRAWTFTGDLRIQTYGAIPVIYGAQNPAPPSI